MQTAATHTESPRTLAAKLFDDHRVDGGNEPGDEVGLRIDQTLTQDATGTLVMLELEALGLRRVQTEVSAQYIDHNLLQLDHKNPDDHLFLRSACERFGVWLSPPGNGVSHPVHQQRFGVPGKTLLGSDSHTPAAGALGMLAFGAGGLEVAMAMAGEPYYLTMPEIWGIELRGELPSWVSAKDVILELLRRHGVRGGRGYVLEYFGPGLAQLDVWDRHVLANMGTELGATTTVFPADAAVRRFLRAQQRGDDFRELAADEGARYDRLEQIDLSDLEPLIAMPSSPGNVRPVREVAGTPIYQVYIGSSANPSARDLAVAAELIDGKQIHDRVSFDLNPASRQALQQLARGGQLSRLLAAGGRLHQTGCNGCIGMGQAPASEEISLRTVPRNFPGRSGTPEDKVCLVSPETAAASALTGRITDPREIAAQAEPDLELPPPKIDDTLLREPPPASTRVELRKGPNIAPLPRLEPLFAHAELPVLLTLGDDISTDEILPAGAKVLPLRSNLPAIRRHCFRDVDADYARRCEQDDASAGPAIVAGENYGQGSSREHAALAPRSLGLRVVIARSYARIHQKNLVAFGVLPLRFVDGDDHARLRRGAKLKLENLPAQLARGGALTVDVAQPDDGAGDAQERPIELTHDLTTRQLDVLRAGGLINWKRQQLADGQPAGAMTHAPQDRKERP